MQEDDEMVLRRTFVPLVRRVFRVIALISLVLLTLMPCLMAADTSKDEKAPAFDPSNMDRSIHPATTSINTSTADGSRGIRFHLIRPSIMSSRSWKTEQKNRFESWWSRPPITHLPRIAALIGR